MKKCSVVLRLDIYLCIAADGAAAGLIRRELVHGCMMGKRRMFLRIHIRLLPVATSAHPQSAHPPFTEAPPLYLVNSCTPTADVSGRQHLWSASQRKLIVPRYRLNRFGRQCYAVAGPSIWNSLPDSLRDPALQSEHV